MAKHGTLPEFMYQRRCVISDEPLELTTLPSGQNSEESMLDHLNEEVNDEEIADEFDPNSDEEVELSVPRGNWKLCYFSPWCTISIWQSCSLQQSFLVLKKEIKSLSNPFTSSLFFSLLAHHRYCLRPSSVTAGAYPGFCSIR